LFRETAAVFNMAIPAALRCSASVQFEVQEGFMVDEHLLTFGPFRLETTQGRLWRGEQVIPLRHRTFAMLRYLAEHPGRLVTKAELGINARIAFRYLATGISWVVRYRGKRGDFSCACHHAPSGSNA
jgi:hypothetical protein